MSTALIALSLVSAAVIVLFRIKDLPLLIWDTLTFVVAVTFGWIACRVTGQHDWMKVPNTPNMYQCQRCANLGWRV